MLSSSLVISNILTVELLRSEIRYLETSKNFPWKSKVTYILSDPSCWSLGWPRSQIYKTPAKLVNRHLKFPFFQTCNENVFVRSSGRSFRTLPLFLQKVIFSLRNYVILRQNSDCWFVAALSERAEFYAYLIIYKGVNDAPDQIDLQSLWPPTSSATTRCGQWL